MPITNNPNGISSFGIPVMPGGIPPGGNAYFVGGPYANDGNSGESVEQAKATLLAAYNLTTANQNDVVFYIADNSSQTLSAAFTWSNSYTHLVGLCAPTAVANRARIFQLSTLTGASPLFTISATGCIFKNFYIFQGVADATSLINVSITGGRNYFENVHFAGGGHATQAIDGGASLHLNAAEENLFVGCTIGVDTIDAATGMVGLLLDGDAHRNIFRDCIFRMRAGNSGAAFIEIVDATGIDRDTTFIDCMFINNSTSNDMAALAVIPAMGEPRALLFKDCMTHNTTTWDANSRGVVFGNFGAITGAALSGVAKELVT